MWITNYSVENNSNVKGNIKYSLSPTASPITIAPPTIKTKRTRSMILFLRNFAYSSLLGGNVCEMVGIERVCDTGGVFLVWDIVLVLIWGTTFRPITGVDDVKFFNEFVTWLDEVRLGWDFGTLNCCCCCCSFFCCRFCCCSCCCCSCVLCCCLYCCCCCCCSCNVWEFLSFQISRFSSGMDLIGLGGADVLGPDASSGSDSDMRGEDSLDLKQQNGKRYKFYIKTSGECSLFHLIWVKTGLDIKILEMLSSVWVSFRKWNQFFIFE